MSFLYWLALVIGGGLFVLSLFGDLFDSHGHAADVLHPGADTHGDTDWGKILSLRNATYFLFAFGAVGVLLATVWDGKELLALPFALATGALAWVLSQMTFAYLKRTESGEMHGDRLLIGRVGAVSLPIRKGGTGKITVSKAGQTQELLARPLDERDEDPESWTSVIVVEVKDGVAIVSPYSESEEE